MLEVVRRSRSLSRMLWMIAGAGALGGCGRLGFGEGVLEIVTAPALTTECGVMPGAGVLEVGNPSEIEIQITGADGTGGFALEDPLPIAIAPGGSVKLGVRPPVAVIGTDRAGDARTGALTLVTTAGPYTVDLVATVLGANVDVTDASGVAVMLTFAGPQCPAPITARVANTGTRPATLLAPTAAQFRMQGFASGELRVDGGGSGSFSVRPFTMASCSGAEALSFTVTGSVCTTQPIVLAATFDLTGASTCVCT